TAADVSSGQQAVSAAQSSLSQAQASRDKLTSPGNNDRSSQESALRQAQNGISTAESTVRQADNSLSTAQGALYAAETAYCADAAIVAARQQLQTAQQKLRDLYQPDASKVLTTQATLEAAKAGLTSAQAHRDEVYAGSKKSDVDLQRNTVALSQLALDKANAD